MNLSDFSNISKAVKLRNQHLFDRDQIKIANRIRQASKPLLNKLENQFFNVLQMRQPGYAKLLRPQAKTYLLANGVRYSPDITASIWPEENGGVAETCWEIKGPHAWDDALVKLKVAAQVWSEVVWWLVWRDESGQWCEQKVSSGWLAE